MKRWSEPRKASIFIFMAAILLAICPACTAPGTQPDPENTPAPSAARLATTIPLATQPSTPVPSPALLSTPVPSATAVPAPAAQARPPIIDHPRPVFLDQPAGVEPDNVAGCGEVRDAPILGGLAPDYPAAWCITETFPSGDVKQPESCLREGGAIIHVCTNLVIVEDGLPRIIDDLEQLRRVFAPIESPEEALSYAVAATGYQAKFEPEDYDDMSWAAGEDEPLTYEYFTDVLEDTHVVETGDGYVVYLFHFSPLSCSPHPVWSVPVQVKTDGTVSELDGMRVKLYQESNYWMCID